MPKLTDEQRNAIESIDKHVLVSAGAGSGKTFVLVERYINVLRSNPEAQISDIIAVTYTRKAAEEMRSRLKSELSKVAASAPEEESARWSHLLSELESARIGTIHSLCESILKNFPAEAGIDPDFAILDDLERAEILAQCVDDSIRAIIDGPLEHYEALLDIQIEILKDWLSQFLKSPLKYKLSRQLFGDGSKESVREFANSFIKKELQRSLDQLLHSDDFRAEASQVLNNPWYNSECRLAELQREMTGYLGSILDEERECAERWQSVVLLGQIESARTAGGESAKDLRQAMRSVKKHCGDLSKKNNGSLNEADILAAEILHGLLCLSDTVLSEYEAKKKLHQKLDFDDLIERCHGLLTKDSPARRQLTRGLLAVLVDEFQDTNWMQAQMLSSLAIDKAKLFLIGDDKQSIYKFQGADVGTFNSCKSFISSLSEPEKHASLASSFGLPSLKGDGALMTLSQSFRSHPNIVNFVNAVFRTLFDAGADAESYKSRFQSLRPARQAEENEPVRIDIIYTPACDSQSAESRVLEDRQEGWLLSNWIKEKVAKGALIFDKELGANRPIKYSDFAILLQANADFAGVEFALAQAKIPYVSIAGSGFLDRQEIYDLENLLKWLICPQDNHALFSVLRSPLFGISDDVIHDLKSGPGSSLWQKLRQKSQEEEDDWLAGCVRRLQSLQKVSGQLSLPEVLRRIVTETAYDIVLLSAQSGKQRSRNVWKFVALSTRYKQMSISEFLLSLDAMRKLGVKNLTDAPLSADDSVCIMTVHRSKGLEFGAVLLPRLGKSAQERWQKLIFNKDFGIALDPTRDKDEEKPTYFSASQKLNSLMGEEEKKRLLYVALTRPRDYLALFVSSRASRPSNFGAWLVNSLGLPEPGSEVYEGIETTGQGDEQCTWYISQPTCPEELSSESPDIAQDSNLVEESSQPSVQFEFEPNLLAADSFKGPRMYKPVPWQALLRVTPSAGEQEQQVNQTVLGNYFHLLMNSLGPNLEFPTTDTQEALCLNHAVSVVHKQKRNYLLGEADRLLGIFADSPLYAVMSKARRCLHEKNYTILRQELEIENLRPDLIIETESGEWQIVDYKTDHFDLKDLKKQISAHSAQLGIYVADFEKLSKCKATAWIYFAQYGRLEPVALSPLLQLNIPLQSMH